MSETNGIDYGPLLDLIGVWKGTKGEDVAPEEVGEENNAYYETITFTAVGDVSNAETQELAVVRYHQEVYRHTDDKYLHDQCGYWIWDAEAGVIMHSLTIPRGVCVLAGGKYNKAHNGQDNKIVLEVCAELGASKWQIIQSPFMQEKAKTTRFTNTLTLDGRKLSYKQTTVVEIYGKVFDHTDQNDLEKQ